MDESDDLFLDEGPAERRRQEKMHRRAYLELFLKTHGFKDVHRARPGQGCLSNRESVYPIHVAAKYADELLRMLLAKKVDLFKETSAGRTAYEIAAQANRQGSHDEVLHYLGEEVKDLPPSTTRTLSAEALAAFSALEVTRPDVLRATPAYRALEHFGLALRSLATGRTGGGGSFGRFMVFWVFATDRSSSS
eukprot:g30387.t1